MFIPSAYSDALCSFLQASPCPPLVVLGGVSLNRRKVGAAKDGLFRNFPPPMPCDSSISSHPHREHSQEGSFSGMLPSANHVGMEHVQVGSPRRRPSFSGKLRRHGSSYQATQCCSA